MNNSGSGSLLEITHDGGLENRRQLQISIPAKASQGGIAEIATKAVRSLLSTPTFYLCEAGFSAVVGSKMRSWSKLNMNNTLWLSLSPPTPN